MGRKFERAEPVNARKNAEVPCPSRWVTYRGRRYLVQRAAGVTDVTVEVERWRGLGLVVSNRPVRPGPTRAAVLARAGGFDD